MNKARAMLDALMGPGRDVVEKDKGKSKEKFKDKEVCKAFLVGLCPLDPGLLGGKRNFTVCDKIHSEIMRQQFEAHADRQDLEWDYKLQCLKSLEHAIRECDSKILNEKARIRDDWGNRRPPLPAHVIDQVSRMKRESSAMFAMAEQLDDDRFKEKEALVTRSAEIMKEAEALEEVETKKAIKTAITEEVCEVCGTCFQGSAGDAAHLQFKIHHGYGEIRAKLEELKPFKDECEKKGKEKDGQDSKKRIEDFKKQRRDNGDQGAEDNDKDSSARKDRRRGDDSPEPIKARDRGAKEADEDDRGDRRGGRDGGKSKRRADSRDRGRSRSDRGQGRGREQDRRRDDSRGRGGGGGGRRDDSRSRRGRR
mmetsp:Transcript_52348/g.168680  ORF Transcript_52348/g.168680 Transcript_52348/m.168680 type:complete len:366 (+) Transcript_52348:101-1198(+)